MAVREEEQVQATNYTEQVEKLTYVIVAGHWKDI